MRKVKFQTDEYYHIYNRGVDKRDIFMDQKDYLRFLRSLREFNCLEPIGSLYELDYQRKKEAQKEAELPIGSSASLPLVKFICYCLLPNHYHLIVKQLVNQGIEKFFHKLGTSYPKYFNFKYNRSGSLFQSKFQAIHINIDSYLLWLSGYINGNPEIHKIAKAENYQWSSYPGYLGKRNGTLYNKKIILDQFKNLQEYKNLVKIIIKESAQRKDDVKKYLLE